MKFLLVFVISMLFPSVQILNKHRNFDKLHVEKSWRRHFQTKKHLQQRSTTSHRACNVLVLFRSVRDYSGLLLTMRVYFVILRRYFVTIRPYLRPFGDKGESCVPGVSGARNGSWRKRSSNTVPLVVDHAKICRSTSLVDRHAKGRM